jgi:hypothetical protein
MATQPFNINQFSIPANRLADPESTLKALPHARIILQEMEALGQDVTQQRKIIDWAEKSIKEYLTIGKTP